MSADVFNPTTKLHEFTNREHGKPCRDMFLSAVGIGALGILFRDAELVVHYVRFAAITFTVISGTFCSNCRKKKKHFC